MAIKSKSSKTTKYQEPDSSFLLKLVLYLIVGSQWVTITNAAQTWQLPIPVGLMLGLFFASHDHFRIDRKIEYAVLLVATLVGFWAAIGIVVHV